MTEEDIRLFTMCAGGGKPMLAARALRDKYDTTRKWTETCRDCGGPVEVCAAWLEVVGPYHAGCFGYPVCSCDKPHKGDCPREPS